MRNIFATLIIIIAYFPGISCADGSVDEPEHDQTWLRETFEGPLQEELLRSGLSPRNAANATQAAIDSLIECWVSERNVLRDSEEKTIIVQLGGVTIVTHASPCMDELLEHVGDLAR